MSIGLLIVLLVVACVLLPQANMVSWGYAPSGIISILILFLILRLLGLI